MRCNLMGSGAVAGWWRYLGVVVASKELGEQVPGDVRSWSGPCEVLMAGSTWTRHVDKMEGRVGVLLRNPSSSGFRAGAWNTYIASCITFPAQLCLPRMSERRAFQRLLSKALGLSSWCPGFAIVGLTLA